MLQAGNPFGAPSVWVVGHSLAGALGSIAALKLAQDPLFLGRMGGVVTYGSPRVGNEAWQKLYNDKLMDLTLRWANFRDLFAALPTENQFCLSTKQSRFSFRHVGRAVQMCPTPDGMEEFVFYPNGTEGSCAQGEFLSIATHLLGAYFDGWRRAYAQKFGLPAGLMLSTSLHVRSVMCNQCAIAVKPYPLPTNKAARNDGVVTCVNTNSCSNRFVFGLVSWSGLAMTSLFRGDATCDPATYTCQVPIPGSGTVINAVSNAVSNVAANYTLADLAELAAALLPSGLTNSTSTTSLDIMDGSRSSSSSDMPGSANAAVGIASHHKSGNSTKATTTSSHSHSNKHNGTAVFGNTAGHSSTNSAKGVRSASTVGDATTPAAAPAHQAAMEQADQGSTINTDSGTAAAGSVTPEPTQADLLTPYVKKAKVLPQVSLQSATQVQQ